jgi:hypothetical protein
MWILLQLEMEHNCRKFTKTVSFNQSLTKKFGMLSRIYETLKHRGLMDSIQNFSKLAVM